MEIKVVQNISRFMIRQDWVKLYFLQLQFVSGDNMLVIIELVQVKFIRQRVEERCLLKLRLLYLKIVISSIGNFIVCSSLVMEISSGFFIRLEVIMCIVIIMLVKIRLFLVLMWFISYGVQNMLVVLRNIWKELRQLYILLFFCRVVNCDEKQIGNCWLQML